MFVRVVNIRVSHAMFYSSHHSFAGLVLHTPFSLPMSLFHAKVFTHHFFCTRCSSRVRYCLSHDMFPRRPFSLCFASYFPMSLFPHVIFPHAILPHVTFPHVIFPHVIFPYVILPHVIFPHVTFPHAISPMSRCFLCRRLWRDARAAVGNHRVHPTGKPLGSSRR